MFGIRTKSVGKIWTWWDSGQVKCSHGRGRGYCPHRSSLDIKLIIRLIRLDSFAKRIQKHYSFVCV